MAPVLLCPECGTKHPLDGVNGSAFACRGCGRTLKVPRQVPAASAQGPAGVPPASNPDSTRVIPTSPRMPASSAREPDSSARAAAAPRRRRVGLDPVPARWIRFLLWFIAVPLGFLIVFWLAKAIGMLTTNQIEDVALTEGLGRFLPIARLLPFVALVTAGLVHGAVYGITRLRARRHAAALGASGPAQT